MSELMQRVFVLNKTFPRFLQVSVFARNCWTMVVILFLQFMSLSCTMVCGFVADCCSIREQMLSDMVWKCMIYSYETALAPTDCSTVDSPQIGHTPDQDKPVAFRACSVSGTEFKGMRVRCRKISSL
jgi:hypothetical protein